MIRLIRIEMLKVRTIRMTYGLIIASAVLTVMVAIAEASRAGSSNGGVGSLATASGLSTVTTVTGWSMLFAAVFGVIISSGEFRHATATLTYLATPSRVRVLLAKVLAGAGGGALFGLVAAVIATAVGVVFVAAHGYHMALGVGTLGANGGGAILGSALLAALGVGLGSLIRSQLAGVIGVFVWALVIESIVGGLFTSIRPYMPYTAATTLAGIQLGVGPGGIRVAVHHGSSTASALPFAGAAALVAGYVVLISCVAALTTVRRDIS